MKPRQWPEVLGLALLGACTAGGGPDTTVGATTSASDASTGAPTSGASTSGATTEGLSTGSDTGVDPMWPPPFMPTPTVDVVLDPGLMLGEGPCIHRCDPADREELPRVMDLCELLGGDARASGPCDGGTCPVPAEVCMIDEFEFGDAYCALDGLPRAYCGGYPQKDDDHVVVLTRITHRLVGAQLVFEFDPGDATPAVQVYLQEGWDEVDDMGDPYPIPSRLDPTGGTITLKSAGFSTDATLSGTYELDFVWPDNPSVARTIRGHFDHILQ